MPILQTKHKTNKKTRLLSKPICHSEMINRCQIMNLFNFWHNQNCKFMMIDQHYLAKLGLLCALQGKRMRLPTIYINYTWEIYADSGAKQSLLALFNWRQIFRKISQKTTKIKLIFEKVSMQCIKLLLKYHSTFFLRA